MCRGGIGLLVWVVFCCFVFFCVVLTFVLCCFVLYCVVLTFVLTVEAMCRGGIGLLALSHWQQEVPGSTCSEYHRKLILFWPLYAKRNIPSEVGPNKERTVLSNERHMMRWTYNLKTIQDICKLINLVFLSWTKSVINPWLPPVGAVKYGRTRHIAQKLPQEINCQYKYKGKYRYKYRQTKYGMWDTLRKNKSASLRSISKNIRKFHTRGIKVVSKLSNLEFGSLESHKVWPFQHEMCRNRVKNCSWIQSSKISHMILQIWDISGWLKELIINYIYCKAESLIKTWLSFFSFCVERWENNRLIAGAQMFFQLFLIKRRVAPVIMAFV